MKAPCLFAVAFVLLAATTMAQVSHLEAEGNLESTMSVDCVPLKEIRNTHTPADIYLGISACLSKKRYQYAVDLFAVAGAFSRFDMKRVKDQTAHQAARVLNMNAFAQLSEEEQPAFRRAVQSGLAQDKENLARICASIAEIGFPTYHPRYMIQHGMAAFTGIEGDGLHEDFDPQKAWHDVLDKYLHCPNFEEGPDNKTLNRTPDSAG